jgi:hypothetical protein
MLQYRTTSWASILDFYTSFAAIQPDFVPMRTLVQWLASSLYAYGLFPLTSMFTLRIGRYPDFLAHDTELTIVYEPHVGTFRLAYYVNVEKPLWVRTYPEDAVQAAIERFLLEYARWFRPLPEQNARDPC